MLDDRMINELKMLPWLKVKRARDGMVSGRYYGQNGAAVRFFLSYLPDCAYLRLKNDDQMLLGEIIARIGPPQLQWRFRNLLGGWFYYAWEKNPERCESLLRSIGLGSALKTGLSSCFGHFDIKRFGPKPGQEE